MLSGHERPVFGCAVSPDGGWVVSASADATLRVWEVASGRVERVLAGHASAVSCCALRGKETVVSGSFDPTLRAWESRTGLCRLVLDGHSTAVRCCAILPGAMSIVSGAGDGGIWIWPTRLRVRVDTSQPDQASLNLSQSEMTWVSCRPSDLWVRRPRGRPPASVALLRGGAQRLTEVRPGLRSGGNRGVALRPRVAQGSTGRPAPYPCRQRLRGRQHAVVMHWGALAELPGVEVLLHQTPAQPAPARAPSSSPPSHAGVRCRSRRDPWSSTTCSGPIAAIGPVAACRGSCSAPSTLRSDWLLIVATAREPEVSESVYSTLRRLSAEPLGRFCRLKGLSEMEVNALIDQIVGFTPESRS